MLSLIVEHLSDVSLKWEVWEVLPNTTTDTQAQHLIAQTQKQHPEKQFRLVTAITPPQAEQDALF